MLDLVLGNLIFRFSNMALGYKLASAHQNIDDFDPENVMYFLNLSVFGIKGHTH